MVRPTRDENTELDLARSVEFLDESATTKDPPLEKGAIPKKGRKAKTTIQDKNSEEESNANVNLNRRETIFHPNAPTNPLTEKTSRRVSLTFPEHIDNTSEVVTRRDVERIIRRHQDELNLHLETWMNEMRRSMEVMRLNLTPRREDRQNLPTEFSFPRREDRQNLPTELTLPRREDRPNFPTEFSFPRRDDRQNFPNEFSPGRDRRRYIRNLPSNEDSTNPSWAERGSTIRVIRESSRIANMKFSGNVGTNNPARFVRNFEENADLEGLSNREKLISFMNSMKGESYLWVNTTDAETYYQLRQDFLSKYWSNTIQQKVIEYILDGKYDPTTDSSMETYFRKWAIHGRYFSIPRSEYWIIDRLKKHFSARVQAKFDVKEPRTISEATDILANLDRATYGLDLKRRNENNPEQRQQNYNKWNKRYADNRTPLPNKTGFPNQKKAGQFVKKPIFRGLAGDTSGLSESSDETDEETSGSHHEIEEPDKNPEDLEVV